MEPLASALTSFPIVSLLVIAVVVLLASRLRGDSARQSLRSLAIVAACAVFATAVMTWAEADPVRYRLLLVPLVLVVIWALVQIVRRRGRRAIPRAARNPRSDSANAPSGVART